MVLYPVAFDYQPTWGSQVTTTPVRTLPDLPTEMPAPSIQDIQADGFTVAWHCYISSFCGGADPDSSEVNYTMVVTRHYDAKVVLNFVQTGVQQKIVTGLLSDTEYKVKVAATNAAGMGPFSRVAETKTILPAPLIDVSVAFRMRLDLPFADWSIKKDIVIKGVADWLATAPKKVTVQSVQEGSTVLGLHVNVRDSAVAAAQFAAVTPGQLLIGNFAVLNISRASELVSNGKRTNKFQPNAVPTSKVTLVTVEGTNFDTYTKCIVDGTRMETTFVSSTELRCAIALNHVGFSPYLSVTNGSTALPLGFYDLAKMRLIDITPSSGSVTGNGGQIFLKANGLLEQLLQPSQRFHTSAMQCRFSMADGSYKTSKATKVLGGNGNIAICKPPPSFLTDKPIGGPVSMELSLDSQHWIQPALLYTYHCLPTEYYVPNPIRGNCTTCAQGALCDGTDQVFAQNGSYAVQWPTMFQKCVNPLACTRKDIRQPCKENYNGTLCKLDPTSPFCVTMCSFLCFPL